MKSSVEEIYAYLNWLYIRTQNLIDQPGIWLFIEALASELLNKHTLSGKEAKAIWEATLFKEVGKHTSPWSSGYGLRLPFPRRVAHARNSPRMDRVSGGGFRLGTQIKNEFVGINKFCYLNILIIKGYIAQTPILL